MSRKKDCSTFFVDYVLCSIGIGLVYGLVSALFEFSFISAECISITGLALALSIEFNRK